MKMLKAYLYIEKACISLIYFNFTARFVLLKNIIILVWQLKYNDTGREKDCQPRVGQWNMMNKVILNIIG